MGLVQIFPVPILVSKKRLDLPRELIIQTSRKKTRKRKCYGGSSSAVWRGKSACEQGFSDTSLNKNEHSGIPHQSNCPAPSIWLKQHNLRFFVYFWIRFMCNEKTVYLVCLPCSWLLIHMFYILGGNGTSSFWATFVIAIPSFCNNKQALITWTFRLLLLLVSAIR